MNSVVRAVRAGLYRSVLTGAQLLVRPRRRVFYRLTILKLDRLGDAVLSLGAVRELLREFGEQETLLVVSTVAEPLFRAELPEVELLVLPPFCERYFPDLLLFLWCHAARLRSISTETLVCLRHQPSDYLHVIAHLIAPGKCHVTRWDRARENVSLSFPRACLVPYPQSSEGTCLELEAHRRLIESVTGKRTEAAVMTPTILAAQAVAGNFLLVCPMAGAEIRNFPPHLLASAIHDFLQRVSMPVEFCLPPEADLKPWQSAMSAAGVPQAKWHRPARLENLLELVARSCLVLAPDSAPAHLATALDKPGVFLLGGGHFGMFAPWGKSRRQVWLHHAMDCYQCHWNCMHPEPFCITHIQPVDVAAAMHAVHAAADAV
jgi:ADP-heptose:LPS heptosyltransferase